jgi:UDP-N-acetylglucosamine 2-epimerase (non-hydrolysing)
LLKENKQDAQIYVTGNTVTDVFQYTVREDYSHEVLDWVGDRKLVLMTAHRREAQGEPHRRIFKAVRQLADEFEDIAIVYPVHPSPAVKGPAHEMLGDHPRIKLIDPLDVVDLHNFYPHTHLILTDSGGLQEEAPSFGVPVLVLRDTTERPEGIEAGTLELVGTDDATIYARAKQLLTDAAAYAKMAESANPYGDGQASARIVQALLHHFERGAARPAPFTTK